MTDLPEITEALLDHIKCSAIAELEGALPPAHWQSVITPETVLAIVREVRVRRRALDIMARRTADCPIFLGNECVRPELPRHEDGRRRCAAVYGCGSKQGEAMTDFSRWEMRR